MSRTVHLIVSWSAILLAPARTAAQLPTTEFATEVDDPVGLLLGVSASTVWGGREAFEAVGQGYGAQVFVGTALKPFADARLGVGLTSHADELSESRAKLLTIYLETYFEHVFSSVGIRIAPRFAWMRISRTIDFLTLRGLGVGGVAGMTLEVSARTSLETGAALTLITMGSDAIFGGRSDGLRLGTVVELRLGASYQL